jgi:hypothetical protein
MPRHAVAELVLAIVTRRWDRAEYLAARGPIDPVAFTEQCRECDVHAWIHHRLSVDGRLGLVGTAAAERLAEMRRKVRNDTMVVLATAELALDSLLAAGVTPIALKGLDFLHRLYAGVDLRTLDDVDLLVRGEALRPALAALRGAGFALPSDAETRHYVRSSHHLPLKAPGPIAVDLELHWNLAQTGRYRIDPGGLFDRAQPLEIAGRRVLRLADTDVVAHLLIHHFSHYFDPRLKWLVDLSRLDEEAPIDWQAVRRRVAEWDGTAAAGISLLHLRKLAPTWIDDEATRAMPAAWWRRALTWPLRSAHPLELYRLTRHRRVRQLLAAAMLERPSRLPAWLWHRASRDAAPSDHPLDERD